MSPVRLVILGILLYVLYRLLRGGSKPRAERPKEDVLVEDPVCHVFIPQSQALTLRRKGTTHYFCSKECRDRYRRAGNDQGERS